MCLDFQLILSQMEDYSIFSARGKISNRMEELVILASIRTFEFPTHNFRSTRKSHIKCNLQLVTRSNKCNLQLVTTTRKSHFTISQDS